MSLSPSGCKEIERLRTGPCTLPLTHALASSPQQCSEPTLGLKLTETGGHRGPPYNGKIRGRSLERGSSLGPPPPRLRSPDGPGQSSGPAKLRGRGPAVSALQLCSRTMCLVESKTIQAQAPPNTFLASQNTAKGL
ncbi:unnamed protein product [Rangifer tarandus platyrhynchus]|uniref:Uncharacterized protein n=1 Tax=Rangifer tarandus platyrhynchus TaxID=3082113 RepID=A0AC59ZAV3_RANTA